MNEEKEQKTEQTQDNTTTGDKSPETSYLEQLDKRIEKLEQFDKRREEFIKREEAIEARRRLGGNTNVSPPPQPKEETADEYLKRVETDIQKGKFMR